MAITVFFSLYTTRLVLEALGVKDFGTFNLVGGIISMLGFLNLSMSSATQRFMSFTQGAGDVNRLKQIFNVSLILHFIIAILLLIILEGAGYFFFNGILKIDGERMYAAQLVYQFMIISTFFTVISVPYDAVINAHENMTLVAVIGIVESILKLSIAIYITHFHGDKLIIYGLLMASTSIFLLILKTVYCRRRYKECEISLKAQYDKNLFNELKNFAGWTFLGSSTSMIAFYGQGIVINTFFGTAVNAAQGLANQISGQLGAFASTMLMALNPIIDKSEGAGDRNLMLQASMMGSKISFYLLMILFVPVLIEMPYILKIWLTNIPPYAIIFCKLLLIKNLIEQLCIPIVSSIAAVGKIKQFQIFSSIISCFPLAITYGLYYLGYPPHTMYFVFTAYAIVLSFNTLYFAKKTCGLSYTIFFNKVFLKCAVPFALCILISATPTFIIQEGFLRLALVTIISFLSFLLLVWNIGLSKDERLSVKQLILETYNRLMPKMKNSKVLLK